MTRVKLSSKNQIVVPREVREKLSLKSGSKVNISIEGERAILTKEPKSYVDALEGLGADVWKSLGGTDKYLERERKSWGRR